jgi:anion-transporting  ArsA/GET3 family ATPase
MNDTIVIDTPQAIAHFRMAALVTALRTEVRTGMKMSRVSALQVARQYGITARTKKAALAELEALYEKTYGAPFGAR